MAAAILDERVVQGETPEVLDAFARPGTDLVIWQRSVALDLVHWVAELPAAALPDGRFAAPLGEVPDGLNWLLDEAGTPAGPMRAALVADMTALAGRFALLAGTTAVDVRLEAVDSDACWKFHTDCVPLRLLTTYRGPGTDWVPPEHGAAAVRAQRAYRGPVRRLPLNAVGVFRGCWGGAAGMVHRSPPVAGAGVTRLLLCLNLPG